MTSDYYAKIEKMVSPILTPLISKKKNEHYYMVFGSACVVPVNEEFFLITATHCIENITEHMSKDEDSFLLVKIAGELRCLDPLEFASLKLENQSKDAIDIAYINVSEFKPDTNNLSINLNHAKNKRDFKEALLCGYLVSGKNKNLKKSEYDNQIEITQPILAAFRVDIMKHEEEPIIKVNLSPDKNSNIKKQNIPTPRGCSGGLIFGIDKSNPLSIFPIGITIETENGHTIAKAINLAFIIEEITNHDRVPRTCSLP